MEEDLGVKAAPVTRLRRRLSVEPEDSPLPTTPSTPTKKRATRLAAKPQLELIDEVVTENVSLKTSRKAAVKEAAEPEGTPTSVTPSRRSTRIRSNTSILSETTTQQVESPRAKRALRRNSQLGSDTESSAVTPARQTRRTRKDSTKTTDKPADENVVVYKVTSENSAPAIEGPTDTTKDSKANETNNHSPSTRKSPRLNKKGGIADGELDKSNNETEKKLNNSQNTEENLRVNKDNQKTNRMEIFNKKASPQITKTEKEKLSASSIDLINEINTNDDKSNVLNKSTSVLERIADELKNKRTRTKSWTTLSTASTNAGFISDTEGSKEKVKRDKTPNTSILGSGDNLKTNDTKQISKNIREPDLKSPNRLVSKSELQTLNISVEKNKELVPVEQINFEIKKSDSMTLFEKAPNNEEPLVLIEDSDSCSVGKLSIDIQIENEDQCMPVVLNPTKESPEKHEQSVEPMDIDESMPVNVTIDDFSDKSNTSKEDAELPESKIKLSVSEKSLLKDESINKSKRKSSVSIHSESSKNVSIVGKTDKNDSKNISISSKFNLSPGEKSNRSSSFSQVSNQKDLFEKSQRKSSISIDSNENSNKSKRLSSTSQNNSEIIPNGSESRNSLEKSQRKLSVSTNKENIEKLNESANKSKRKSSVSSSSEENKKNNDSKSTNKSRKDLLSQTKSEQSLEKSGNENKSTLVISQLKDVSTNDANNVSSPNVTKKELSKSMNEVKSNEIDKNIFSLNYLTSTPIQQNSLQKLTIQINTSVISPSVDKNYTPNVSRQPDSSVQTDEKINLKNRNVSPKKKLARALSSSESDSDDETDNKPKTESVTTKKSPKLPVLDSSDSSDSESDSNKQNNKKLNKTQPTANTSKEDLSSKKPSASKSDSSEHSDEEPASSSQQNNKKNNINKSKTEAGNNQKKLVSNNSESSDDSEEEYVAKIKQNNKKTPNTKSKLKPKKNTSNKKTPGSDSSESSDDSEENVSKNKSGLVDDEVSEASNDYESGDSQNEEDRKYQDDNEIVEKGETLDSEEDFSNDSDYEKDSFLVSSDAEDYERLSGTGDDLSMSDNELTMGAKSKKKFNERKLKQQKKASREMYEARHKKDESANSSKSKTAKKIKRQRLESSTLDSENEDTQPTKSNRLRINSSQDSSMIKCEADESIGLKKKKTKRLSESVCQDVTMNENEITVFNQSTTEKNDPLTIAIKQEPKTPLKQFNLSSVAINENIEEVEVDSNASIMRQNETLDPLQDNRTEAIDDDDSSSSGGTEIIQNYDSVLNNLSMQTKKIKTVDTSLNLNRKSKDSKNPMIDQLNLTQTKSTSNKDKNVKDKLRESFKTMETSKVDDDLLDSIDMKLLFSEDSNDSEINASQRKPIINEEPADDFIPLKRTEAKTNIHENIDKNVSLDESLNVSKNKIKMRKSSKCVADEVPNKTDVTEEPADSNIKIIIDTTGTNEIDTSISQTSSSKKKNKKNKSFEESMISENAVGIDCTDNVVETQIETSFMSEKKKKKNKNKSFDASENVENSFNGNENLSAKRSKKESESTSEFIGACTEYNGYKTDLTEEPKDDKLKVIIDTTGTNEFDTSISQMNSSKKKKNKKNKSFEESKISENAVGIDCVDGVVETPIETSLMSEKKKKKNKNKSFEVSENIENSLIGIENNSAKKSRKKSESTSEFIETCTENTDNTIIEEMPVNISIKSDKKKKKNKHDVSQNIESVVETTPSQSAKKKSKKTLISASDIDSQTQNTAEDSDEAPMEMSYKSEKKSDATDAITDDALTTSSEKKKHKKNKKKKNKNLLETYEVCADNETVNKQDGDVPNKRKRKAFDQLLTVTEDAVDSTPNESSNEKKRLKTHLNDECIAAYNNIEYNNEDASGSKKTKKNKKSKNHQTIEQEVPANTNNKKRKNRDNDDDIGSISKIPKQNSFDEIHVPTLPESILNQLPEKRTHNISKKNKTKSAIATMPFVVEEAERRKNKPSNYLEQSVYLNDSPDEEEKQQRPLKKKPKPKVLPFTPTAVTSDSGYTSKFNINVLPAETVFVAQASNVENFRESLLGSNRIKKLGTFERLKRQRGSKMSKF